jgi:hypothetical protein
MIYEYGEPRWNDIDRGKPKEKTLSQFQFVHHKSHVYIPACELGPVTNRLSHGTALRILFLVFSGL